VATLTAKQESFALATVKGYPPLEAYKFAYNTENMSDAACSVEASRLFQNPMVALRIDELRELIALKTLFPLTERLTILRDIAHGTIESRASEKTGAIKVATEIIGDSAAIRKTIELEHSGHIETTKPIEQLTDDELANIASGGS
jgi:phage terminase small subunit